MDGCSSLSPRSPCLCSVRGYTKKLTGRYWSPLFGDSLYKSGRPKWGHSPIARHVQETMSAQVSERDTPAHIPLCYQAGIISLNVKKAGVSVYCIQPVFVWFASALMIIKRVMWLPWWSCALAMHMCDSVHMWGCVSDKRWEWKCTIWSHCPSWCKANRMEQQTIFNLELYSVISCRAINYFLCVFVPYSQIRSHYTH